MGAAWPSAVTEHVEAALEATLKLPEGPRREVLVRAHRSCNDLLQRPFPDASAIAEALRAAMQPAMVLAAEDAAAQPISASLGLAYNAALTSLRPARLEAAVPSLLADGLTEITRDLPRTVSIQRAALALDDEVVELAEADAIEDDAIEDDASPEGDPSGESAADLAAPFDDPPPAERPPREDWRPTEGVVPEPPPLRLLDDRRTIDVAAYHAAIVEQCLEAIATAARDRSHDPFSTRPSAEQKILAAADAVLATGGACVKTILAWWSRAIESPSPWSSWAAPFALGCIEGPDTLIAVRCGLERLAPDAIAHGEQAAEALAVVRHTDRPALALDLAASPHPVARAVGVDMLARAGRLAVDQLRPHLFDGNPPVVAAALRAASRMSSADGAPLAPLLERWIHFPDAAVAELAARTLLRWGDARPYDDLRGGGRLAQIVGARALPLFVLAGSKLDLEPLQALVARSARTPALFDALGRFGHPGVAPFLVHHLADEDLADPAAEALITLFGRNAAPEALLSAPAWKAAIAALKPDPATRYRRGEPWKPSVLAAECTSGELSRAQMDLRLDELAARAHIEAPIELGAWTQEAQPMLRGLSAAAGAASATWPAAGWT